MSTDQSSLSWPAVTSQLLRRQDLDRETAAAAMREIMRGDATPVQIAGFLIALRAKGETAAEISGLVEAMREFAVPVKVSFPTVDTCGTGGDRAGTFNVSTVAAVVAAGAGAKVAKHGNRAASGRCGSADLLEQWGVAISLPPDAVARCVEDVGIGFCFAPDYHPAMRHAIPVRRELGTPTVFNILGPLTNPAGAQHQTIGVSDPELASRMAEVLAQVGTEHALVFHGDDGLDELTTTGPSIVWEVRAGAVTRYRFDPAEYGIPRATRNDLLGGDLDTNRTIADKILDGKPGAARDIVLVAAAAALRTAGTAESWEAGLAAAEQSISSGAARHTLDRWVALSQKLANS